MIHRILLGLVASVGLVACLEETTSLGGPRSNASASTTEEEDEDGEGRTATPSEPGPSGGIVCVARGYTWIPEATGECEYLLPTPPLSHPDDPDYHPATWNQNRVVAWAFLPSVPQSERQARYTPSSDACGTSDDGWYYVESDAAVPTHFALCPAMCSFVTSNEDVIFRLTSWKPNCD